MSKIIRSVSGSILKACRWVFENDNTSVNSAYVSRTGGWRR